MGKIKPLFTNVHLIINNSGETKEEQTNLDENLRILLDHLLPMLGSIRKIECATFFMAFLERKFPGTLALAKELDIFYALPDSIPTYLNWLCAPQDFDRHGPRFLHIFIMPQIPDIVAAVRQVLFRSFILKKNDKKDSKFYVKFFFLYSYIYCVIIQLIFLYIQLFSLKIIKN